MRNVTSGSTLARRKTYAAICILGTLLFGLYGWNRQPPLQWHALETEGFTENTSEARAKVWHALEHRPILAAAPSVPHDPVTLSSLLHDWPRSKYVDEFPHKKLKGNSMYTHNQLLPVQTVHNACVRFDPPPVTQHRRNCEWRDSLINGMCPIDLYRESRATLLLRSNHIEPIRRDKPFTMSESFACGTWKWEHYTLEPLSEGHPKYRTPPLAPEWIAYAGYDVERLQTEFPDAVYVPGTTAITEGLWHGVADAFHNFFVPFLYALDPKTHGYEIDHIWVEQGCVNDKHEILSRDPNSLPTLQRFMTQACMETYAPQATILKRNCTSQRSAVYCFEHLVLSNYESDYGRHPGGDAADLFHDTESEKWATEHLKEYRKALYRLFKLSMIRQSSGVFRILVYYREDAQNHRNLFPSDTAELESMVRRALAKHTHRDLLFTHWHRNPVPTDYSTAKAAFQTIQETDLLITPHGSFLANIGFMRPGSRIWEVSTFTWIQSCFHGNLCNKLSLKCCLASHPSRLGLFPDTRTAIDSTLHEDTIDRCWRATE